MPNNVMEIEWCDKHRWDNSDDGICPSCRIAELEDCIHGYGDAIDKKDDRIAALEGEKAEANRLVGAKMADVQLANKRIIELKDKLRATLPYAIEKLGTNNSIGIQMQQELEALRGE